MSSSTKKTIGICRLCRNKTNIVMEKDDLFNKSNNILLEKIKDITGILLKNMPRLNYPRLICSKCKKNLIFCHEFRSQIIKSQSYFKISYQDSFENLNEMTKEDNSSKTFESVFVSSHNGEDNETLNIKSFSDDSTDDEDNNLTKPKSIEIKSENFDNSVDNWQYEDNNLISKRLRTTPHTSSIDDDKFSINHEESLNIETNLDKSDEMIFDDNGSNDSSVKNKSFFKDKNSNESDNSSIEDCEDPNDPDFKFTPNKYIPRKVEENDDFEGLNCNELKCYLCDLPFKSYKLIKSHWHKKHKGLKRLIKCELCEEKFPMLKSLKRHTRFHKGEKLYKCHFCEQSFDHGITRSRHERRLHSKDWPFLCAICGKAFISLDSGKGHMTVHTKERAYHCTICKSSFLRNTHLRTHYRSETHKNNERKFNEEMQKPKIEIPETSSQNNFYIQEQIFLNMA